MIDIILGSILRPIEAITKQMVVDRKGDQLLTMLKYSQRQRHRSRTLASRLLTELNKKRMSKSPYDEIMRTELLWLKACSATRQHRIRLSRQQSEYSDFVSSNPTWKAKKEYRRFQRRIYHALLHSSRNP